ncbi:hypothetical protein H2248_008025 [Termitomyces sp. 'cryptogamus']|nr:hypothetical protein H2248_008025 [Termitomyces sp. 'cryptogamus']
MQLWALGRAALPDVLASEGHSYVAPLSIPLSSRPSPPRELTTHEVEEYHGSYAQAAKNAVENAGFDGVKIHAAYAYLINSSFKVAAIKDLTNTGEELKLVASLD